MVLSARRNGDVQDVYAAVLVFFRRGLFEAEIFLPWAEQNLRGNIFENFEVLEERADGVGTFFRIRGESDTVNRLRKQLGQTMDPSKSEP